MITADLHLNDNPRDGYRHDFITKHLLALIMKHRVHRLYILGDLTDEKDEHRAWLTNKVVTHLQTLAELCPVVVLKGNHDYITADTPFFEFLGDIRATHPISWIGVPTTLDDAVYGKVLLLPHTTNYKRDWADLNFDAADLVMAHQTFAGAAVGPRKMDGIPPAVFKTDVPVISGDIHVPQTFRQITYVGAPYTVNFGDDYSPRVLVGANLKSVPCPGPQKRLVEVESVAALKTCRMVQAGDQLKVRLSITAADHARWPELRQQVQKAVEGLGCSLWAVQPHVVHEAAPKGTKRTSTTQTDEQLLVSYAKARAVGPETLKVGQTLLREA